MKTTVSTSLDMEMLTVMCVACIRDFAERALKKVEEDGKKEDLKELDASRLVANL